MGPRGIAVVDVGATNTKVVLFDGEGAPVAERRAASRHVEGPPYRWIDPEPMVAMVRQALPELNRILPIDVVVPTAHGAALACLNAQGGLALPVVDYTAEPPPEIVAQYRKIMPKFEEVCAPLLQMAITHGLQLYWQQQCFPEQFKHVTCIMPWIQYIGFRLSGRAVTEITSMACQTHLLDVVRGGPSSLARSQGWDKHFPPMAKAWEVIGETLLEFGIKAKVLAGIHDSSANYVRYLASGLGKFTLLSTGTWIISFDTETPVSVLREEYDTCSNTDTFGKNVACSRFFGGREYETLAASGATPSLAAVARLVARGTFALPSFTGSAGPMPGTEKKGRIIGQPPDSGEESASLASLYCALMVSEQLDAVHSRHDVIVDGPFTKNPVFLSVLAQLRDGQKVLASALENGTAAGAACLALMQDGKLPHIALKLLPVAAAGLAGLEAYQAKWRKC